MQTLAEGTIPLLSQYSEETRPGPLAFSVHFLNSEFCILH